MTREAAFFFVRTALGPDVTDEECWWLVDASEVVEDGDS